MTTVMGLVIPYDERRKAYMRRIDTGTGDALSAIVGGPLEMVRLSDRSHMYINEEAKLSYPPLPYNISANRILVHTPYKLPKPGFMFRGPLGQDMQSPAYVDEHGNDFIAGNAVILGSHKAPEEGDVQPEVIEWCDKAEVEIVQQVSGMPVTREGATRWVRGGPEDARVIRAARAEAAARRRLIEAGGDPDALEREMMEPTKEMDLGGRIELERALSDADSRRLGGVLGMTPEQRAARERVRRAAEAGTPGANDPRRVWSSIVPDDAVRGRHRDQEG